MGKEILSKQLQRCKVQLSVPCLDCSYEQHHLHYHLHVASEHLELRILAFLFLKVLHFSDQINRFHDLHHFCSSFFDLFLGFFFASITQLLCAILDFLHQQWILPRQKSSLVYHKEDLECNHVNFLSSLHVLPF